MCLCPQKEEGRFAEARNPRQAKLLPVNHGCDKDWCLWAEGAAGTWLKEERTAACFAQRRCWWKTSIILLHYLQSSLPNFGLRKKKRQLCKEREYKSAWINPLFAKTQKTTPHPQKTPLPYLIQFDTLDIAW